MIKISKSIFQNDNDNKYEITKYITVLFSLFWGSTVHINDIKLSFLGGWGVFVKNFICIIVIDLPA